MKKTFTKFMAIGSIGLLMLAACKKDGTLVVENGGTAGTLTSSVTTPLVLNSANLTNPATVITFSFTKASFGYSASVTNSVQIDAPSDNWANPITYALGTSTFTQSFNTADFNNLLLKLNLKGGVASTVNIRIQQSIGGGVAAYTNVITLTVTPFNLKSWLYVAGAYEGWANPGPKEDSLYSATSNGIYVGIINFTAGNNQFLVLPAKNWSNKYATNDAQGSTSSTVTYNGPNNFYAPTTAGQYLVTLNLNANTINFALADYYSLIGPGSPSASWSADYDLKYLNDGSGNWTSGVAAFSAGQFKVRQDHGWTYSWGLLGTPDGVTLTNNNGGNINVANGGNFTFNISLPASPFGTLQPVTTTYSFK